MKVDDDGFRLDAATVSAERISEDADYEGIRVKILGYLENARVPIQIDLGFGDVITPAPVEMNIPSEDFLVKRLSEVEMYQTLFKEAFPDEANPITYDNIEKAIGAFERTLLFPAKWDKYLAGEKNALTLDEKKGLKTFIDAGCVTCHTGSLLGANMFQKFGVYANYWDLTKSAAIDSGRYVETKMDADLFMFKVPSLRNVNETGPYFHDGSVSDLNETIKIIAKTNLNKELTDEEVASIAVFLKSLSGEIPAEVSAIPEELL